MIFITFRLCDLKTYCLEVDEIFSLSTARLDWRHLFSVVTTDAVHPPLFYVLLKVWITIGGDSLVWLRLLPALTAIAALGPFILLCRALRLGRPERNIALALMTTNGFLVDYSHELRMYSLLLFFSLTSLWLFVEFLKQENESQKHLWALFAANLFMISTHYYGWMVIVVEGVFLLIFSSRRKVLSFLTPFLLLVLLFTPWIYFVARATLARQGLGQNLGWISVPGLFDFASIYANLNGAFQFSRSTTLGLALFGIPVIVWGISILIDKASGKAASQGMSFWLLLLFSILPVLFAFVASQFLQQSIWGERHLIIVSVPYMILVAASLSRLRPVWLRTATLALCIGWTAIAGVISLNRDDKKVRWDHLVQTLIQAEPQKEKGIRVFAFDNFLAYPLQFYLNTVREDRFHVQTVQKITDLQGEHYWVAYRNTTWKADRTPQALFTSMGYQVGNTLMAGTATMQVGLFPVWRQTTDS